MAKRAAGRQTLRRIDPETGKPIGPKIDLQAEERERARYWLPHAERMYQETRNPVYAWEAFLDSRIAGVAVPSCVLEYFERCAHQIAELARWGKVTESREEVTDDGGTIVHLSARIPERDEIAPAIAAAMEFVEPGRNGRKNALRVMRDDAHELSVSFAVYSAFLQEQRQLGPHQRVKDRNVFEAAIARHLATCDHEPRCKRMSVSTITRCWKKHAHLYPPVDG